MAGGVGMSEIPDRASAADAAWQAWYKPEHDIARAMATSPYGKMREAFAAGFEAAAATATRAHIAEQDAVHADLSQLLRVLGMGDHARPQSSHEVMLDAINEVGKIRGALERAEALLAERDRQRTDLLVENGQLRDRLMAVEGL
jgi:hypothetical protein